MSVKLNESQIKYLGINKKNDLNYNLEINGTTHTNGRIYSDEWVQFNETAKGLYWPNGNNTHLYPNNVGSYGSLIIMGDRGGYNGILLGDTQDYMVVMSSPEHQGLFNQANNKWIVYYNKTNGRIGIGTSTLQGYNNTISGSTYIDGPIYSNTAFTLTAGKVAGFPKGHAGFYGNGIAISNPATANDMGWIRMTGTGESDSILEIAVGDDGGGTGAESVVVRQYNTNNAIVKEAYLLNPSGNTSFPGTVTAPAFNGNASSATVARHLSSPDTRATAIAPSSLNASTGVQFDFKQSSVTGLNSYAGIMSYRPYSTADDWTGGPAHQLGFDGDGLHYRTSQNSSTWNSWSTILNSSNYTTYLDGRYINASGDTMSGALHFANGTWNNMGDDAAIGDSNVGGAICIKGLNGATKLHFAPYSGSTAQAISINGSGTMTVTGNLAAEGKFVGKVDLASNRLQDSASGYHQIFINSATAWMTAFTIRVYQAYKWSDIVISGYNYGSSYWYSPSAVMTDSSTVDSIQVIFGYTSAYNLWVAIPAQNYYGIEIVDCVSGYAGFDSWQNLFTISHVSSLSGTTQATVTVQRPWHRGEQLTSTGLMQINANGKYLLLGPQNSSHAHYSTDASSHWFNTTVHVNGSIYCGASYSDLVLSSANYSSYALPLSGGTLTGTLFFNNNIGIRGSMGGGTDWWELKGSGSDDAGRCQLIIADNATSDYFDLIFRDYTGTDYVAMSASGSSVTFGVRTKFNDWVQFNGVYGISWPNSEDLQILPNHLTSYCGMRIRGGRGGYHGILCGDSNIHMHVMSSDEHQGLYNESNGRWIVYYNRPSNIIALGGSSSWGYTVNVNGSLYASSSAYIADVLGSGTRIYTGYDSGITGSISCSNWFRSNGATGWYNATYDGGWYMSDTTWVRTHNSKGVYTGSGQIRSDRVDGGMWITGTHQATFVAGTATSAAAGNYYQGWYSGKTQSGAWSMGALAGSENLYFVYGTDGNYNAGTNTTASVQFGSGGQVYGAVWNDYAEYRNQAETLKPGQVAYCDNDGKLKLTTFRMQKFEGVVSDTYGFAIGETDSAKTPLAVSGRVLVYTYEDRSTFNSGDCVCAGPDGRVCKMTREEITYYPDRIVGVVSEIPEYDTWGTENIDVDNRIWIKVK